MNRPKSSAWLPVAIIGGALIAGALLSPAMHAQTAQPPRLGSANATLTCQYTPAFTALTPGQAGQVVYLQCDANGNVQTRTAPASGASQTLAASAAASANQAFTSTSFGYPKQLSLCLAASAATTFTVTASIDGTNWEQETLAGSATSANFAPSGAGSQCETIAPAPYVRVATSAANTVTAEIAAAY